MSVESLACEIGTTAQLIRIGWDHVIFAPHESLQVCLENVPPATDEDGAQPPAPDSPKPPPVER